jgi:predicted DNA-binding antitoxin AbrB/MazE fold protein
MNMNKLEIEATYENCTLKLPRGLPLQEGQKITITISLAEKVVKRRRGLIHWRGSQEDLDFLILSEENDPLEAP